MKAFLTETIDFQLKNRYPAIMAGARHFIISVKKEKWSTRYGLNKAQPENYPLQDFAFHVRGGDREEKRIFSLKYSKGLIVQWLGDTVDLVPLAPCLEAPIPEMCGNWLTSVKPLKKGQAWRTRVVNTVSREQYYLDGNFKPKISISEHESISEKSKEDSVFVGGCARVNFQTREIFWLNSDICSVGEMLNNCCFYAVEKCNGKKISGVYSIKTGKRIRTLDMPSYIGLGGGRRLHRQDGLFVLHSSAGTLYKYDVETDTETSWVLWKDCGENQTIINSVYSSDELVVHDESKKKIRIFKVSTKQLLGDYPFSPPFKVRGGVYKTKGGFFCLTQATDEETRAPFKVEGKALFRAYCFTLDELENPDWENVEHEQFLCQHERIQREDGDSEYRVFFKKKLAFATVLRHLGLYLPRLGKEYGLLYGENFNNRDRDWGGLLRVDLRNQKISEKNKKELEFLVAYTNQWYLATTPTVRSGTDLEEQITIQMEYADD